MDSWKSFLSVEDHMSSYNFSMSGDSPLLLKEGVEVEM